MLNANTLSLGRIRAVHFIGIGGAGMGGIAEVLLTLGYKISGSDTANNAMVQRLSKLGAVISAKHEASNVDHCDVVVISSAIAPDNVEWLRAIEKRIPVVQRANMLGELMRFKQGIAIAGAHGKTTTTSLVSSLLAEAHLDPTFVIGGVLNRCGSNARLGAGRYFVAEADESDASFLHLMPMIAVVTNIDHDHLENYQNDFNVLKKAYLHFLQRLPFYGLAVLCVDDPEIHALLPKVDRPFITYGFSEEASVRAIDFSQEEGQSFFTVIRKDRTPLAITLNLPGKHNVLNALAAITVASEEGLADEIIQSALLHFQGVGRRFQRVGTLEAASASHQAVLVIDDYGHHPKEIQVVLETMRASWPQKRLVMVYQPHRYTRTKALFEDFVSILSTVDVLILLEVYSAGEAHIQGADGRALAFSIRTRGRLEPIFVADKQDVFKILADVLEPNDVLLMQGAGDISGLVGELIAEGLSVNHHPTWHFKPSVHTMVETVVPPV